MTEKLFIGGGFPGIKNCITEKTILTKESREKQEFSPGNIISINQILSNKNKNRIINSSEKFNLHLKFNDTNSNHESSSESSSESSFIDSYNIKLINKPLKK